MRSISNIIELIYKNLLFALVSAVAIGLIFFIIYIVLRKLNVIKQITKTKQFIIFLFTIYTIFVLSAKLITRNYRFELPHFDLSLFSSYRNAWHEYSLREFELIIIAISMFVPLGVFLPLLDNRFRKWLPTLFISIIFSLVIELLQLVTHLGVFVMNDILNNTIGASIGFGLTMFIIRRPFSRKSFLFLAPLLLVFLTTLSVFVYYQAKPFGNLSISAYSSVHIKDMNISPELSLSDNRITAMVYKAPTMTREASKQFAYQLYEKIQVDTSEVYTIDYQNEIFYRYQGNPSYFITVHLLDSTFNYTDFSHFNQDSKLAFATEAELKSALTKFNISIPDAAQFNQQINGNYSWTVDHVIENNQLINGKLSISYYDDGTIKLIDQDIVYYDEVKAVPIISEQEAYTKLTKGKFKYFKKSINTLEVKDIKLVHSLDSKGYYQPVYQFDVLINGEDSIFRIAAID